MHFAQAQTHKRQSSIISSGTIIEALHIKTPICARIPISQDRLAVFINHPSVTKDQALEETVLTGLFHPVVHGCFQLVGINTIEDTIARYDVVKGQLSKVGVQGLVHTK